jgi:SAM-dependent methyltransferase
MLDSPRRSLIVDFGTGTGTYAIRIAAMRPDVTVVALDEQPEMLERLRAKPEAGSLANLRLALPTELVSLRGRVDRVLALNVLHELGDDALRTIAPLFGTDGFAVFIDWNAEVERPVGPPREHVYGPHEATKRLKEFGFKVEGLAPLPYHYALRARPVSAKRFQQS